MILLAFVCALLACACAVLGAGAAVWGGMPLTMALVPAMVMFFVGALLAAMADWLRRPR